MNFLFPAFLFAAAAIAIPILLHFRRQPPQKAVPFSSLMFLEQTPATERLVQRAVRQGAEIGPALWPRSARWDAGSLEPALAAVRAPVLVIQTTTRDPQTGKRGPMQAGQTSPWLELLKERLKDVKIEIIPGVGHFPQLEAPDEVNRLIAEASR